MDHTCQPTVEIIQRLKDSLSDCDELRSSLNALFSTLGKEDEESVPEVCSLLLGSAVQVLSLDEVGSALLEHFLPLTKNFMSKKLQVNLKIINDGSMLKEESRIQDVLRNIEVCIQVLNDIDSLLVYLTSFDQIKASDFCSTPKNIAEVVYLIFSHCQKSQAEYKDVFSTVKNELMSLFQQCHQVQIKLYTLLNNKLVFNCAFEEEVQLLIDVFDILNSMSEVVAELDTMSLVAHWKGFAQLSQTYATYLRPRLNVTRPITYLAANIAHQLGNLKAYVDVEKKVVLRALKISSLQLKVLIKLCEQYKDHLGDCYRPLFNCLISLTARTPQSLSQDGLTAEIAAQVTTHLSAGAAPLLTHLLTDPLFVEYYLQYADELNSSSLVCEKFGYCNLSNIILKKLMQLSLTDNEIKNLWLKPTFPLVDTVFKTLHNCTAIFFSYEDDTYQTLLTHTAAFIIATTADDMFPCLERLLFKHLLQPSLWPALFSSDLFCLIARVGSSNLCLQLAILLSDLCSCWPAWDRCRPEWNYVNWTLNRLTQFLAVDDLKAFPSRLPAATTVGYDINTLLKKPFSDESIQLYDSLLEKMSILRHHVDILPDSKASLAQPTYQLWEYMTVLPSITTTETPDWFCTLFSVVVPITSHIIDLLDNTQIGNILDVLGKVSSCSSTIFKCAVCEFLKSLANKCFTNDSSQSTVCERISSLFVALMKDKNALVKQLALETFSYFAYVTKYEEIVASTVAKNNELQNEITHYLKGIPIVQSHTDSIEYVTKLNAPFVHKCKQNKTKLNEQEELNPSKKLKISLHKESLSDILMRMEKDVGMIESLKKCSEINENQMSTLKCLSKRLDEIIKSF